MLVAIAVLVILTVVLVFMTVAQFASARPAAVAQRLEEIGRLSGSDAAVRRRRQRRSEQLKSILQVLGERVEQGRKDTSAVRQFLIQAGYTDPNSVAIYWATRVSLCAILAAAALLIAPTLTVKPFQVVLATAYFAALGWIAPTFYVRAKLRRRQKELQLALPDTLDMLVVCVEAGLGLNQALLRVADEIDHVSPTMSEQLTLTNLQIRAGTPREEALKNLADRTGLTDVRSLVGMLIQTDRFGTSIANALRIQSETLRTKRRQRAEEAAAKTTIKLVFPLVLFVFPAMFIVTIGPAVIQIFRTFNNLR